jgi:Ser/Thr protein kinase RdoA (MazF antagonist)
MTFFTINELEQKQLAAGLNLRSVYLHNLMLTFVDFEPGVELPRHSHPHEQITLVIEGTLEFTLDKETKILNAGARTHDQVGQGGESWVFALDNDRVARINRPGADRAQADSRTTLLEELRQSNDKIPFAIPQVLDTREVDGIIITIERRLPGRPLIDLLAEVTDEARPTLIRAYLEAAAQIGELTIRRSWYGDLLSPAAIRTVSYHEYLQRKAARSLKTAGPKFKFVNPALLAADLPKPEAKSLVHLDAFPGNMLAEGTVITAVLDFGASCLIGDRRLDPLAAAVYLDPAITPTATAADHRTAQEWLAKKGFAQHFTAAQKWIAAYWSFAIDDTNLYNWCRKILVD